LLASAGFAHRSLAVAVVRPDSLRRIVEREALLGLGVLSVTSFLVATPPARTTYAPPFVATVQGRDVDGSVIRVVLDVAPTRVGLETIRLHTYTTNGAVQPFAAATGSLIRRGDTAGAVRLSFVVAAPGQGVANGVVVPSAGDWMLTVQVITNPTTDYAASTTYPVD